MASGGIPSGPAVLPDLRDLMALEISVFDGGAILMSRACLGGGTLYVSLNRGWRSI